MPGDPLFDTLFRSTATVPQVASAAPVRSAGTRSRAGNAMGRTRAALLSGARRAVEVSGTKITMAQVAAAAGVAKATLYNHFRTREAVLIALLDQEVASLIEQSARPDLRDALTVAASQISEHPLVRALARQEPATLAALASVDTGAAGWQRADEAVRTALAAAQRGGSGAVLRWLSSYLLTPAGCDSIGADAAILVAGLPPARPAGPAHAATRPSGEDERWAARPA